MEFRIADTFTESLAKLTGEEQKAVKTTAFDLQINPASPGMSFHKLDKPRDPNFSSVRVNADIRLIVHRTVGSLLLCYVDHHDAAYRWAERRRLETHPTTGAAQLVEMRETIKEIVVPKYVEVDTPALKKPALFANLAESELLAYGVPPEWIQDVCHANEDSLLVLADHLPREAAEALLELAIGGKPLKPVTAVSGDDPFKHPDAQSRFRVMNNAKELELALAYPWEKWTVFLHPAQRTLVEKAYNGPARVSGSAGTGKSIVALHRAVCLARRHPDARVLLTTFSDTLASALKTKLKRLVGGEPKTFERIEVYGLAAVALRLYVPLYTEPRLALDSEIRKFLNDAAKEVGGNRFSDSFLWSEWRDVVDAWQLNTWEAYKTVPRLGRKTRLSEKQREVLWSIVGQVREELSKRKLTTEDSMFARLAEHFQGNHRKPYEFIIVDESQDIGVSQLRFLAALGSSKADGLFFAGDLGQRIFQPPFSWKALGIDIRGRSQTLKINYRTSHQIRRRADMLLPSEVGDVDGLKEDRRGTVSVFNGPEPTIKTFSTEKDEIEGVSQWLAELRKEGFQPHEIGLFVRTQAQLDRAREAVALASMKYVELSDAIETQAGKTSVCTMQLAKGLEFRAVAVMACDDEVVPLQERIEEVADDSDLEEVYNTERHLLYVACTRARDRLLVTGVEPVSEFLNDMQVARD